ncbi:unnamed protein product [Polarella glacialis]|uniref:Uncharacterized protein n=1 Tax=Polarella glacialis TaxID=89957 RepID=A0A813I0T0_POLGL|nr:unnamed protein product [Polarella glacialis]
MLFPNMSKRVKSSKIGSHASGLAARKALGRGRGRGSAHAALKEEGDKLFEDPELSEADDAATRLHRSLPVGLPVHFKFPIPTRWSPGELAMAPPLICFRQKLLEQYPEQRLFGQVPGDDLKPSSPVQEAVAEADAAEAGDAEEDIDSDEKAGEGKTQEGGASSSSSLPPEKSGLSDIIGRKDHLGELIRSMENRLARQGLLAAPATILGKRRKEDVMFYDADASWIDDSDLKQINLEDERRRRARTTPSTKTVEEKEAAEAASLDFFSPAKAKEESGPAASEGGLLRRRKPVDSGAGPAASDSGMAGKPLAPAPGLADLGLTLHFSGKVTEKPAPVVDVNRFMLTGMEFSGTSEEESDDEDDKILGQKRWIRDGRHWRAHLASLREDLVQVAAGPAPAQNGPSRGPSTEEESLEQIGAVLTDFCNSVEAAALGPRFEEDVHLEADLEAAVQALWRRLPPLLRLPAQPGNNQRPSEAQVADLMMEQGAGSRRRRWKLHALEPHVVSDLPPTGLDAGSAAAPAAPSVDVDVLPWTEAEEVAWFYYLWRLLVSVAPQLRRETFTRSWLLAAKGPQKEAAFEAERELGRQVRAAMASADLKVRADTAVRRWKTGNSPADPEEGGSVSKKSPIQSGLQVKHWCLKALWPLVPALSGLRRVWHRKQLWQEQRRANSVRASFARLSSPSQGGGNEQYVAVYLVEQLKDHLALQVPWDLVAALLKSKAKVKQPSVAKNQAFVNIFCFW